MAGEFVWKSRLLTALLMHLRGFLITGVIGLVCFIYLFYVGKLTLANTPVFLIVLSNCWGLFLIIVLLGYGLVAIPRTCWESGDNFTSLHNLYIQAISLNDGMTETKFELDEIVKLINAASYKLPKNSELQDSLNYILSLCPIETLERQRSIQSHLSSDANKELGVITEKTLIKLHKQLKDTSSEYLRSKYRWEKIINESLELEDVIAASNSPFKCIVYSFKDPKAGKCARNLEVIEWFWLTKLRPFLYRVLAIVFSIMSILIILGEITLFLDFPIGLFPLMFKTDNGITLTQVLCALPLSYIILCTYFGLFNLKLSGWYGLYPNNHTDSSSLVWSSLILARLSAPLCYNFLLFLKIKKTVYSEVMGLIDLLPFVGTQFTSFFPLLLIVFCFLNAFKIYGKVMSTLGMSQLSFEDSHSHTKVNEGKALVQRAKSERQRNFDAYNRKPSSIEIPARNIGNDLRKDIPFRRAIV